MNKKIIILGGGTAGWFSALFCKKFISDDVTLIEDKQLGIIGVGEGTVPLVIDFLNSIDVDVKEVIKKTKATLKNGISFERWNKDDKNDIYFHPFNEFGPYNNFGINNVFTHDCRDYYIKELIGKKLDLKKYMWSSKLSYENKVDNLNCLSALHFDTFALGDYLSTLANERGIKHIDGQYVNANLDKKGFVNKIILKDGRKFKCDFIFDCTGFKREILRNKLNEKFISYSDTLPMKKAIIFPKMKPGNFPYTKAIAMKNGWIFEIPLQNRIGRGYIFDSDYTDETKAKDELINFYKEDVEIKKVLDFEVGRMNNAWVKNCIGIGLSQSFVEPLEATSIFVTTEMLNHLKHFINNIENHNEISIENYNTSVNLMLDNIKDFLRLHYISKRKDSLFWKELPKKYKISDDLNYIIKNMKNGNLYWTNIKDCLAKFELQSWMIVGNGLGIFNKYDNSGYKNLTPSVGEMKVLIDNDVKNMPLMKDWLNSND